MLRKELLDARRALRGVREGASGPSSKKQRGEWERERETARWESFHSGEGSHRSSCNAYSSYCVIHNTVV